MGLKGKSCVERVNRKLGRTNRTSRCSTKREVFSRNRENVSPLPKRSRSTRLCLTPCVPTNVSGRAAKTSRENRAACSVIIHNLRGKDD